MKTKSALILLGLGLACSSAYAAHGEETPMPMSNDINVTLPEQTGTWSFGATAVLMQPINSNYTYADAVTDIAYDNNSVYHYGVKDGYYWWFGADVTYAFPGNGRDVTLAYEGLHGSSSDSTANDDPNVDLDSNLTDGYAYSTAAAKVDTNYDAGDLVFGQKMDVGTRLRLHPFVGVRYAHINVQGNANYANTLALAEEQDGLDNETGELDNTFNGIGPRLGSDAQINLGQGFSLRGRLGLSALIGSRSNSLTDVQTNLDGSYDPVNYHIPSETLVVPEVDGRLGLNYTCEINTTTALGFEAGWQVSNYFGVLADQNEVASWHQAGQSYEKTTNFGLQGPYARVQLDIA